MTPRRTRRTAVGRALTLVAAGMVLFLFDAQPPTIGVTPDSLARAVAAAPENATLRLAPGVYRGPVRIDRPLTVEGDDAWIIAPATASAAVAVVADGVSLRGVTVEGGDTGIMIREAEGVVLEDLSVEGSTLHGIEVVDASATIDGVDVRRLASPLAQGIEVRNSDGRPRTTVRGAEVIGGQEGLVSHVSDVIFVDNAIRDTTLRAVAVTEMSTGIVARNRVTGAVGSGLYCGDMSRCALSRNDIDMVGRGAAGRSNEGWGLLVTYHSVASIDDDALRGRAGPVATLLGSRLASNPALELGDLRTALWPLAGALASVALLLIVGRAAGRLLAERASPSREPAFTGAGSALALAGIGAGLAVQTFHMVEHFLQVFRVKIDAVPSRGGIVGPAVDSEVIHLAYNAALLVAVVGLVLVRRNLWRPSASAARGDLWLAAALLIQGYHVVEHVIKVGQHVVTGAKVNPGLLGNAVDLVWLHFSVNLAVYVAFLFASIAYLGPVGPLLRSRGSRARLVGEGVHP